MKHFLTFSAVVIAVFAISPISNADDKIQNDVVQVSSHIHGDINSVIKKQLQAIRERNDRAAYELNVSEIQEKFEDPQGFMRNLRRSKASLYNHVDYKIIPQASNNPKFHKVLLTDKFGKSVMSMFKMQQNDNGDWKIKDILVLSPSDDAI